MELNEGKEIGGGYPLSLQQLGDNFWCKTFTILNQDFHRTQETLSPAADCAHTGARGQNFDQVRQNNVSWNWGGEAKQM